VKSPVKLIRALMPGIMVSLLATIASTWMGSISRSGRRDLGQAKYPHNGRITIVQSKSFVTTVGLIAAAKQKDKLGAEAIRRLIRRGLTPRLRKTVKRKEEKP
jgi:hypothetical protein